MSDCRLVASRPLLQTVLLKCALTVSTQSLKLDFCFSKDKQLQFGFVIIKNRAVSLKDNKDISDCQCTNSTPVNSPSRWGKVSKGGQEKLLRGCREGLSIVLICCPATCVIIASTPWDTASTFENIPHQQQESLPEFNTSCQNVRAC